MTLSTPDSGATFSPDRLYRYRLWRHWDHAKGFALWCMLNPSTADETKLDPTLRRCQQYSRDWGYGGFEVCNLFGYRATDPKALRTLTMRERVAHDGEGGGNSNEGYVTALARRAAIVVCGWGSLKDTVERGHAESMIRMMLHVREHPKNVLHCLGENSDHTPSHPLYLPKNRPLQIYRIDRSAT